MVIAKKLFIHGVHNQNSLETTVLDNHKQRLFLTLIVGLWSYTWFASYLGQEEKGYENEWNVK